MATVETLKMYIDKCDIVIRNNDCNSAKGLVPEICEALKSDYKSLITDLDSYGLGGCCNYMSDIKTLKSRLENEMSKEEERRRMSIQPIPNITINNSNTNTNTISNNAVFNFSDAKDRIMKMESLSDEERNEILNKLKQLELVNESNETSAERWNKSKGILNWLADKGVDIALTLLPLIFEAINN